MTSDADDGLTRRQCVSDWRRAATALPFTLAKWYPYASSELQRRQGGACGLLLRHEDPATTVRTDISLNNLAAARRQELDAFVALPVALRLILIGDGRLRDCRVSGSRPQTRHDRSRAADSPYRSLHDRAPGRRGAPMYRVLGHGHPLPMMRNLRRIGPAPLLRGCRADRAGSLATTRRSRPLFLTRGSAAASPAAILARQSRNL